MLLLTAERALALIGSARGCAAPGHRPRCPMRCPRHVFVLRVKHTRHSFRSRSIRAEQLQVFIANNMHTHGHFVQVQLACLHCLDTSADIYHTTACGMRLRLAP